MSHSNRGTSSLRRAVVLLAAFTASAGSTVGCIDKPGIHPGVLPAVDLPGIVPVDPHAAHRGEMVYERYCEGCHGERGDGRGPSAPHEVPRPRSFVAAVYQCRSTPSGSLPLPSDLEATINRGLHDTAMPGWEPLGIGQIHEVAEYLRTFSPRWTTEPVARPIAIPAETPDTEASRAHGHEVYEHSGCLACHGPAGQGDGPASSALRDETGQPIAPFDFSRGELHCGSRARDVYRTLMAGMDGTPMPSFAASLEPSDAWDLVHFVRSLRR